MRCSKACQKDVVLGWALTAPTRNIFTACCALTASGHKTAIPLDKDMNSRRFMSASGTRVDTTFSVQASIVVVADAVLERIGPAQPMSQLGQTEKNSV